MEVSNQFLLKEVANQGFTVNPGDTVQSLLPMILLAVEVLSLAYNLASGDIDMDDFHNDLELAIGDTHTRCEEWITSVREDTDDTKSDQEGNKSARETK